jgi:hypothetical protein
MELSKLLRTAVVTTTFMMASAASHALLLEPGNADFDGNDGAGGPYGPSTCEVDCINDLFGTSFIGNDNLLYKVEYDGGAEEGSFTGSYNMSWSLDDGEPSGGTLSWVADTAYIECGECYVAVKDGNNDPRYYFYDISTLWDGQEDLVFSNFWSNGPGAISHISIWGVSAVEVPEPGTLGLLGLGLLGLAYSRKRKAS